MIIGVYLMLLVLSPFVESLSKFYISLGENKEGYFFIFFIICNDAANYEIYACYILCIILELATTSGY